MNDNHFIRMGTREAWGRRVAFGLDRIDRRQHCYVVGKTGVGKSTLLRNMIVQDILAGDGVGLIDPHGDLALDVLDHIPAGRSRDVVYFNPADQEFPIAFNLLRPVGREERHLVADGIVSAFKSVWRDSWGPRLQHTLYATIAALLECSNVSLLGVSRMLADEHYRAWVVRQCTDPVVRAFWLSEFAGYDKRFLAEVIAPVQNKVGQLLMAAPLRNVLGQIKSTFDVPFLMNNRRIFIANLSKGQLGEEKSNLLGAMLVTQFQLAAMQRATVAEADRRDFFLYVDEFHNFATDSFASILSESRKYRLGLTLSHQYTAQLHDSVRDAVFGNVGNLVSFRVGDADAKLLEREFGGYSAATLSSLGNFEICARLLDGGEQREAFLGRTVAPALARCGRRDKIIRRSRQRYATPRRVVEDKIGRWLADSQ